MLQVVLIDDERPALKQMELHLSTYKELTVVGMYTNPLEAIEKIETQQPDAVFLDIHMPQLRGLDAASEILDRVPHTEIIFVTAYDDYAIEAFDLHALDYVLKPVEPERLERTIERLVSRRSIEQHGTTTKKLRIQCLGRFQVSWEGEEPIAWRTKKNKELISFLLYHRRSTVTKEDILDALWPDLDQNKAIRQLYNGMYYIRKALENYGIDRNLLYIDKNYKMWLGNVELDVTLLDELEDCQYNKDIEALEEMVTNYHDDYLRAEYYAWAEAEQGRLAHIYRECLLRLVDHYIENENWDQAEAALYEAYQRDPFEEQVTLLLLSLFRTNGSLHKAVQHYAAYTELLRKELNVKPTLAVRNLYRSIVTE